MTDAVDAAIEDLISASVSVGKWLETGRFETNADPVSVRDDAHKALLALLTPTISEADVMRDEVIKAARLAASEAGMNLPAGVYRRLSVLQSALVKMDEVAARQRATGSGEE